MHWFVNRFHDHLRDAPHRVHSGVRRVRGRRPGAREVNDGADTGTCANAGFPDGDHVNNANMTTLPDGLPPIMEMYLYRAFRAAASTT